MSFKSPCPCKFPPRILPPLGARQGQSLESSCRERLEVFGQRTAGVQPEANVACWVGRGQHGRPLTSARCSLKTENRTLAHSSVSALPEVWIGVPLRDVNGMTHTHTQIKDSMAK
ncbi:BEAN1 isoform 10 [Pan troglodytes]|uniref:BEAN1 isoform 10 n=1 Tax=Pan troglodytes TaxID=9598 RepID=A0A2J8MVE6_PANTR|nr:BEAN1 isoform 10 [Pan troglodytes]